MTDLTLTLTLTEDGSYQVAATGYAGRILDLTDAANAVTAWLKLTGIHGADAYRRYIAKKETS